MQFFIIDSLLIGTAFAAPMMPPSTRQPVVLKRPISINDVLERLRTEPAERLDGQPAAEVLEGLEGRVITFDEFKEKKGMLDTMSSEDKRQLNNNRS